MFIFVCVLLLLLFFCGCFCYFAERDVALCVDGSIFHGLRELFFVPASASRLINQRPWYMLSCIWFNA